MEILHTFTDRIQREPIPKRAEQHRLSDFTVNISKESEIIPGKVIVAESYVVCPKPLCDERMNIDHGMRVLCKCGLMAENYGNSLVIWMKE